MDSLLILVSRTSLGSALWLSSSLKQKSNSWYARPIVVPGKTRHTFLGNEKLQIYKRIHEQRKTRTSSLHLRSLSPRKGRHHRLTPLVRELVDDVAHYSLDENLLKEVDANVGEAQNIAAEILRQYREYIRNKSAQEWIYSF